jgi:dTDP-4-amino-4,6-dideoxygalactose transaminase
MSARTRAVVVVHLFGNVVDVAALRELLDGGPILVIEDCAQAHGGTLRGAMAGTLADASAFSFYPTKNLGAYGDAGLCWSADTEMCERMRRLRSYGFDAAGVSQLEGRNSRLDELQAAVLNVKLAHLPDYLERRRALADAYEDALPESVVRLEHGSEVRHARHLYVVRVRDRETLRGRLEAAGIGSGVHYPVPIHRMPAYASLGLGEASLPNTERLAHEVLSLPMYPELPVEAVYRVCEVLRDGAAVDA